ncbi:hypothetical protein [Paenibacillus silagei]|uniref:Uncharacterized protein n=1 Tax=Paenibacillus silagei TaxID=1670801 RepID=A0ABS4NQN6_9BACL|nr:hypothetical protein [Paenibacillus silagei]MBP2111729.1 hypothetical protein [Paenibacillus silagei]
MNTIPAHAETRKKADIAEGSNGYIDEQLLPQQVIEGGGPFRRVDLSSLPGPVKYIGYMIVYGIPVLLLSLIVAVTFFK